MSESLPPGVEARRVEIRGVVQGVGFRPFVFRTATAHGLAGWVLNGDDGVVLHVEGPVTALDSFVRAMREDAPPAAQIASVVVTSVEAESTGDFVIRESVGRGRPRVRIAPDLALCGACRREMFDPADRRHLYPYLNCTDCGPRYSIVLALPYDRPNTTMRDWPLCADCEGEYHDPGDRRFHAQPVACPACGPRFRFERPGEETVVGNAAITTAAGCLREGDILAVKGVGGYHLACAAEDPEAVSELRRRKSRAEKPFAVMARDLETAREVVELSAAAEERLLSVARPIVLARARVEMPGVAPGNDDLGVMLPYAPLHDLLFASGAPDVLVLTSGNRSSEPIATGDEEARDRLADLADAFLVGERPIARRVDDSVVRVDPTGTVFLRRSRGYAPGAVASFPPGAPVLAVGADLKNTITLVVDGEAFVSQHIGDLAHWEALEAFRETIDDLLSMYRVDRTRLTVMHDLHPQYASTRAALELEAAERRGVQHHEAHVAAVVAERGAWERDVVGVALDGTGWGTDGAIWGGEIFAGSVVGGFDRAASLRPALLPGGDAAARHPVQAAAGILHDVVDALPDLTAPPFDFPRRWDEARMLVEKGVRTWVTTSAGRLFDAVAALLGFTRPITFEGQAAMWLEHLARRDRGEDALPAPFLEGRVDPRPALVEVARQRLEGREPTAISGAFHRGLCRGLAEAVEEVAGQRGIDVVALSGGVLQNRILGLGLVERLSAAGLEVWTHEAVPPNDGGISLGQAALALRRVSER